MRFSTLNIHVNSTGLNNAGNSKMPKKLGSFFKCLYTHISQKIQTTIVAFPHNSLFNSKYNSKQRPNWQP